MLKPHTLVLISQANEAMLKIPQAMLQQYMNQELPDVQAGFRNSRGTRDQIANIHWIIEKERIPEKTSASLTTLKLLTCVDHSTLGRFLKRWEYQTTLAGSWETCVRIKKQQLELDMEQLTGSKLGKEKDKAV